LHRADIPRGLRGHGDYQGPASQHLILRSTHTACPPARRWQSWPSRRRLGQRAEPWSHGTRSTAVERVVKEVCPHTCNACEAVDVTQVARSVGIEIRKPDVRWAGQPPPNCEMLAAVTIPEATLAQLADGGPPAYAKSCFALRHCRADILPRVADFHRPVDDPETIAHIVAHCYLNRESNVSNACCAGSPYPGTGGGSGESLRRPPPPPNPSPPKPPPPTGGAAPSCPRSNRTCIRASPPHPMLLMQKGSCEAFSSQLAYFTTYDTDDWGVGACESCVSH